MKMILSISVRFSQTKNFIPINIYIYIYIYIYIIYTLYTLYIYNILKSLIKHCPAKTSFIDQLVVKKLVAKSIYVLKVWNKLENIQCFIVGWCIWKI